VDAGTVDRSFGATSTWNTPTPAHPVLDPGSGPITVRLARADRAYALLYEFGRPISHATAADHRVTVRCTIPWGVCDPQKRRVRIPTIARPSSGSDGVMVVIEHSARTVCDFWQMRRTAGSWTARWGTCASLDGDGSGPSGGATGAGVNGLAGVVRTDEIPASHRPDCIPEGGRMRLDPSIDVAALPGITRSERAVAVALQTYAAYVRDNGAAPMAFVFEKPTSGTDPYPAAGFRWDYDNMPHIPWLRLRVLRTWSGR